MMVPTDPSCGFTGTQKGMTPAQHRKLCTLIPTVGWWHHGDCIGADAQSHVLAKQAGLLIAGHRPYNPSKRAFCAFDYLYEPAKYIARNHRIVLVTQRLIAAPSRCRRSSSSGAWATIRYARKVGKPVTIIWPDGRISN